MELRTGAAEQSAPVCRWENLSNKTRISAKTSRINSARQSAVISWHSCKQEMLIELLLLDLKTSRWRLILSFSAIQKGSERFSAEHAPPSAPQAQAGCWILGNCTNLTLPMTLQCVQGQIKCVNHLSFTEKLCGHDWTWTFSRDFRWMLICSRQRFPCWHPFAPTQWLGGFGKTLGDGGSLNLAPA